MRHKLFSTVGDFTERHEAVHYGSFMDVEEIENYDAILTKIKDVVKVLIVTAWFAAGVYWSLRTPLF